MENVREKKKETKQGHASNPSDLGIHEISDGIIESV
jgi:hypothetical protein